MWVRIRKKIATFGLAQIALLSPEAIRHKATRQPQPPPGRFGDGKGLSVFARPDASSTSSSRTHEILMGTVQKANCNLIRHALLKRQVFQLPIYRE